MGASITFLRTIKRGRLSVEERDQIVTLADRGLSPSQIALRINRHPSTVNGEFVRLSIRAPKERAPVSYIRNGVEVRSFSADEDVFMTALRVQGYGISKIADLCTKRFGHPRKHNAILMRLRQLAAREDAA